MEQLDRLISDTTLKQQRSPLLTKATIVRTLETVQDTIIVCLCIGLFGVMTIQIRAMFFSLLPPAHFREVTADILYLLILVELFRLLIIYLQEQRVSVGVAVEVAIVSVLREIIVNSILEVQWTQILATCAFLMVMALLLVVRVWLPPTFDGIDPEHRQIRLQQIELEQKLRH